MIDDTDTPTSLAREARQDVRHGYVPEIGQSLSTTEQSLIAAVSKLMQAVELLDSPRQVSRLFPEQTEPPDPVALEELYAQVTNGPTPTQQRKFVISFPEVTLGLEDIWPNGDAPEHPSPEDVIAVMRETERAHPTTVTTEWKLVDTLYVRYHGDDDGDMEVEWNGD